MTAAAAPTEGAAVTTRPSRRRARLRVATAVLTVVAALVIGWHDVSTASALAVGPPAADGAGDGWATTSGDSVARIDGEPATTHTLHTYAAVGADHGYRTRVERLLPAYTIRLVDSPGIELYRVDVEAAAAALRAHSGVHVTVANSTIPARTRDTATIDVAVTAHDSPCGAWIGGLIGCGGWEGAYDGGALTIRRGSVWIAPYAKDLTAGQRRGLVLHEIGHAVGLDHYDRIYEGSRQLMYPQLTAVASFQSGDRNGLAALGGHVAPPPSTSPPPPAAPRAPTPTASAPASTSALVHALYVDLLGRPADQAGHAHWVARIESGTPIASVTRSFARSDEWLGRVVDGLYEEALGRPADTGGRAHWVGQLRHGTSTPAVAAAIWGSTERVRAAGGTGGWVQEMYTALLGRPADPDGYRSWVGTAGVSGHSAVARSFYQSHEKRLDRVEDLYAALLARPADPGGARWWAERILHEGDVALAAHLARSAEYRERATQRFG